METYIIISAGVFVVSLVISIWDTITFSKYVTKSFGYNYGRFEIIKEYIWDFGGSLVVGIFWPIFLVMFAVMGVLGWKILK